jgi:hypothetical protein
MELRFSPDLFDLVIQDISSCQAGLLQKDEELHCFVFVFFFFKIFILPHQTKKKVSKQFRMTDDLKISDFELAQGLNPCCDIST